MKKRIKVATALSACALCLVMAGGAAYAIAPSVEAASEDVHASEQAAQETYDSAFAEAYVDSAKLLALDGVDELGNAISFASGSPSITGAPAQHATQAQTATTQTADAASEASAMPEEATTLPADTLEIFGNVIPYAESTESKRAPDRTAGLWLGSDSTTDGSWGYFIGHHPGVFNCVMYLEEGDQITVCDSAGHEQAYTVFNIYDVPDDTQWGQISSEVTSHGESIVLQTCCGDHESYRIVEAAAV